MKFRGQSNTPAEDHSALASVVLIVLETLITALLRVDEVSRQIALPFIRRHAVLRVNTQFPALVFYASFTEKGVLFDLIEPPRAVITGTVTATLADLVRGFLTAPSHVLDKIQIEGDLDTVQRIETLMQTFNLERIVKNSWQMFWKSEPEAKESRKTRPGRSSTLVRKLEQQHKLLEQLNVQLLEQRNDLKDLQVRYARMMVLAIGLGSVLLVMLALIAWYFWS